jgi:hypothetical protein
MSEPLRSTSEPAWAAFAAIDWADQKHSWRLLAAGSKQSEQGELKNTPEAVEAWAAALEQRFGGRPVAVCLEQTRGALVYMLAKYPHLVLFPVHPTTLRPAQDESTWPARTHRPQPQLPSGCCAMRIGP